MFGINKFYIYGIVLAALVAGVWFYGHERYGQGREDERFETLKQIAIKEDEMMALRRKHAEENAKLAEEFAREQRKADAKIEQLLAQNKVLKEWWETRVPVDAVAYAWGVPDVVSLAVSPGQIARAEIAAETGSD